jgi:hypothetical protein
VRGGLLTGGKKRAMDLQDGKLAGSYDKYGGEHEPNADSKHCQGCDEQSTEDQQPVPSTDCKYWSAGISVIDRQTRECGTSACKTVLRRNSLHSHRPSCTAGAECGRPDDLLRFRKIEAS